MHEESLIRTLITRVESIAMEHGAADVERITVEIGPLTGVEKPLLLSAFDRLRAVSTMTAGSSLVVDPVTLDVRCHACGQVSTLADFHFRCVFCACTRVDVIRGDAMNLRDVTLRFEKSDHGAFPDLH